METNDSGIENKFIDFYNYNGSDKSYSVYLPNEYDENTPIICLDLGVDTTNDYNYFKKGIENGNEVDAIILFPKIVSYDPSINQSARDANMNNTLEFIEDRIREYSVSKENLYFAGFSLGGIKAQTDWAEYIKRNPDLNPKLMLIDSSGGKAINDVVNNNLIKGKEIIKFVGKDAYYYPNEDQFINAAKNGANVYSLESRGLLYPSSLGKHNGEYFSFADYMLNYMLGTNPNFNVKENYILGKYDSNGNWIIYDEMSAKNHKAIFGENDAVVNQIIEMLNGYLINDYYKNLEIEYANFIKKLEKNRKKIEFNSNLIRKLNNVYLKDKLDRINSMANSLLNLCNIQMPSYASTTDALNNENEKLFNLILNIQKIEEYVSEEVISKSLQIQESIENNANALEQKAQELPSHGIL